MTRNSLLLMAAVMCFMILSAPLTVRAFDQSHQLYAKVLQQYVKNGSVDYRALKLNPEDLKSYLNETSSVSKEDFNTWPKETQLSFLINLYNAKTLDLVQEHYPVTSIKEINRNSGGPWTQPVVKLFGNQISLDALENDVIRKNYNEPRVHFALVCAAKSCPELPNKPYIGKTLKSQLDTQTRVFLNDPLKNSIDTKKKLLRLSPLFDWFSEDFIKESGSVIAFVNPYLGGKEAPDFKIEYTEYDWTLNSGGKE